MAVWVRDKSFYKYLLTLALPIMLQSLISFGVNFADNLMVGRLSEAAIAGVYMGSQIQGLLSMLVGGIEGGILVLAAQYWGKKDIGSIKQIIAIGVRLSLYCGIALFLASFLFPEMIINFFTKVPSTVTEGVAYLRVVSFSFLFFSVSQILISSMRSVENVRIGLIISIISLCANVIFNYIFIFGKLGAPAMGAAGAALATAISRLLEMVVMLIYVLRVDEKLQMRLRDFLARNRVLFRDFLRYGLPIIGGSVVWSINMLMQSMIIGGIGESAIAAVSISNTLFNFVYIGNVGISSAVSILTGKTVGAGQYELMKQYAKTIQLLLLGIGILSGLIIFCLKGAFIGLYNLQPETVRMTTQFLTVLSITIVGTSYQAAGLAGLVKAGGDVGFVFLNDTIFVFGVVLPSAMIALYVFNAPAWVVFLCLKSDQILKCFVAVVKINRFKWMKNLTRDFSQEAQAVRE